MTTPRPSYRDVTHWRKYLPYLPPSLNLPDEDLPQEEWWSWRGGEIHLDRYRVEGAPLPVVILHGAGGYGRLFAPYGRLLKQAGYEVVAPDLPGYGLSRVPPHLVDHDAWVNCICDLVHAEQVRKGHPIVLFGGSLGGYLSYLVAAKSRAVAGVMATTLADPRLPIVRSQFARHPALAKLGLPLLPLFDQLMGKRRLPIKWFSNMHGIANDLQLTKVFTADRIGAGNKVSVHFMRSLFEARPALEPENFDVCPILLAHPAADRWTTLEASLPVFERLAVPKQLVILDNCGHFPIEEPGVTQLKEAAVAFLAALATNPGLGADHE